MAPDISVVLPCYRSARLARSSAARLRDHFLASRIASWEIVVVDDGGGDFTDDWPTEPGIRLIRLPVNRGKGAAVVTGMLAASGRARIYTDVDLPYGLTAIATMADYLCRRGFHFVIGDRTMPGAEYHSTIGWQRRMVSRLGSKFVGSLVTGGFFDTQCGIKGLRGDVADLVLPLVRLERFAFDVELIYIALLHRLDIKRLPVRLEANQTSSVRVFRDTAQAFVDVLRIKLHQVRGLYSCPALDDVVLAEIEAVREAAAVPDFATHPWQ